MSRPDRTDAAAGPVPPTARAAHRRAAHRPGRGRRHRWPVAGLWHLTLVLTAGVPVDRHRRHPPRPAHRGPVGPARPVPARRRAVPPWPCSSCCARPRSPVCVWWAVRTPAPPTAAADRGRVGRPASRPAGPPGRSGPGTRPRAPAGPASPPACSTSTPHPWPRSGCCSGTTTDDREPVVLTLEDQVGIIAATGAGKTLYLMIGACLDAPGPLIATSTKPEILDAIVEARTGKGRVWVFDPLNVANWPEPMIWNPVTGAEQLRRRRRPREGVRRRPRRRRQPRPAPTRSSGPPPAIIIARLLHAAALTDATMVDVVSWALDLERSTTARDILDHHPDAELFWAQTLRTASEGADETLSSVRMTLGAEGRTHPEPHRDAANAPHPRGGGVRPRRVRALHGHPGADHRRPGADQRRTADHDAAQRGHRRRQSTTPPGPTPAGWTRRCGSSATRSPTSPRSRSCPGTCPTPGVSGSNGSPRSSPSRRSSPAGARTTAGRSWPT